MANRCPAIASGLITLGVSIASGIETDSDQGKLIFDDVCRDQHNKQTFGNVTRQEFLNYITNANSSLDLTTANEIADAMYAAWHDEKADPGNMLLEIGMWRNDKKTFRPQVALHCAAKNRHVAQQQ